MTPIAAVTAAPVSMRWHMAETARTETRSRTADASARSDEPRHHDGARRSPLYRALIGALRELVAQPPATPTPIATDAAAAPVDAVSAPTPSADTGADVEQALMNFSRALMQTLRGDEDGPGRHGRGHGHHAHHDHGRRAWGDPARRIEQVGVQIGAEPVPGPTPVVDATTAPDADNAASTPDAGTTAPADSLTPVASVTAPTAAPSAGSTVINLTINIAPPPASRPVEGGLLDAFRELQQALGRGPSGSGDGAASLGTQLASFLRALADRLAQDAPAVTDLSTQPGALIDLRA